MPNSFFNYLLNGLFGLSELESLLFGLLNKNISPTKISTIGQISERLI